MRHGCKSIKVKLKHKTKDNESSAGVKPRETKTGGSWSFMLTGNHWAQVDPMEDPDELLSGPASINMRTNNIVKNTMLPHVGLMSIINKLIDIRPKPNVS